MEAVIIKYPYFFDISNSLIRFEVHDMNVENMFLAKINKSSRESPLSIALWNMFLLNNLLFGDIHERPDPKV